MRNLPADFADDLLVALAERRSSFVVASVATDLAAYRRATRQRYRNLSFE